MNDIGEKIRLQRLMKKYSQEYMAFMLEISQAAYSKIERDETELTVRRIYEISEILEISPFTLLPKPKYGSGISLLFYQMLERFHKLWNKITGKTIRERKAAYWQSQGH